MMKWDTSKTEARLINKIAIRAVEKYPDIDMVSLQMDLTAIHLNDAELELESLLTAKNVDFYHDVFGIINHIDRNTGKLKNYFSPRYTLKEPEKAAPAANQETA